MKCPSATGISSGSSTLSAANVSTRLVDLVARSGVAGTWINVAERSFGVRVYRVDGRETFFVKASGRTTSDDRRFHAPDEAVRLNWLRQCGFPAPEVIDVGEDEESAWLVTRALTGRPASGPWSNEEERQVLHAVATTVRTLHAVSPDRCPFDGGLSQTLAWATHAAQTDKIDLEDIDPRHAGWSAEQLLAALKATSAPPEDIVVCHGDLCLDNILIDPDRLEVCGILDVGRLGTADRWRDLAVLLRDLRDTAATEATAARRQAELLATYDTPHDPVRDHFYWLLDEFF